MTLSRNVCPGLLSTSVSGRLIPSSVNLNYEFVMSVQQLECNAHTCYMHNNLSLRVNSMVIFQESMAQ